MATREYKDHIGKRLFRNERLVEDLLRGFVPAALLGELDYATLRPLPTEFVNRRGVKRIGDVLWLADRPGGASRVLVMIENEARGNRRMAARMAANAGLLYESLTRRARDADGRYPSLLPLVIHSGERPWTAPADLGNLVARDALSAVFVAGRRLLPLDLGRFARDDLPPRNRMSVVVRLHTSPSASDLAREVANAFAWIGEDERDLRLPLLDWVYDVVMPLRFPGADRRELKELEQEATMLAERAKRWTEEWLQEGIERGKAQGIEQGKAQGIEQGKAQGIEQGKAQGIEQGKAQGIEQGKAQGIEQGIGRERALLSRLTARRFGDRAGERLAAYLAGVNDPARLESVADLIVECASGGELIDRVNALSNGHPG